MTEAKKTKTKKVEKEIKKEVAVKDTDATLDVVEIDESDESKKKKYWEAIGGRKEASARVRIWASRPWEEDEGKMTINGKTYKDYFKNQSLWAIAEDSLRKMKSLNRFEVSAIVRGGGLVGQAEAIRHGIAKALVQFNNDFRKKLKRAGYLKRDPRTKERMKPGLKKARRSPQWAKR